MSIDTTRRRMHTRLHKSCAPSKFSKIQRRVAELKICLQTQSSFQTLNILLYADYAHVFASVAAIARVFPTFSRKTKKSGLEAIQVEIVVTDEKVSIAAGIMAFNNERIKTLNNRDLVFLQALADSMRQAAHQVDMPANELHTEKFVEEAERIVDGLKANIQKTIIKVRRVVVFKLVIKLLDLGRRAARARLRRYLRGAVACAAAKTSASRKCVLF